MFYCFAEKILLSNLRKTKNDPKKNSSGIVENQSVASTSSSSSIDITNNDVCTASTSSQLTDFRAPDFAIASNLSSASTVPEPIVIPEPAVELESVEPVPYNS
ncbi:unnamed protein product [Pieris macdunnoughi]|uniref:Uncharacterized protein n=1 Tax=Pieris macdunnoughi TaxID=345717 RepID=A0A821XQB7_9NEOP|nr:unnamed protein product [Pieris macdunnoughi]